MTINKVPILMIVYNRPDLTQKVFSQIIKFSNSKLYVAGDGPKNSNDKILCKQVKDIFKNVKKIKIIQNFSNKSLGCKIRVASALKWFFSKEKFGIILEDDCLPGKDFFKFCAILLKKYEKNDEVLLVSGTKFLKNKIGDGDYYFSKYPQFWGWATWRRFLKVYDPNIVDWPRWKNSKKWKEIKSKMLKKEYLYWQNKFNKTFKNKIDTWDYQILLSMWINNRVAAITNSNLIENIGLGPNATHTLYPKIKKGMKIFDIKKEIEHPRKIHINELVERKSFLGKQFEGIYLYFPFNILIKLYRILKVFVNIVRS